MSRAFKIGGGLAAVGAGYYFYQAGGDPKVARKTFEGMFGFTALQPTESYC